MIWQLWLAVKLHFDKGIEVNIPHICHIYTHTHSSQQHCTAVMYRWRKKKKISAEDALSLEGVQLQDGPGKLTIRTRL